MTSCHGPVTYAHPEKIIGCVYLKKDRDLEYVLWSGAASFVFTILMIVTEDSSVTTIWVVLLLVTLFFVMRFVSDRNARMILRDSVRINIAETGFYLENQKGEIIHIILFSRLSGVKYFYYNDGEDTVEWLSRPRRGTDVPSFVRFGMPYDRSLTIPRRFMERETWIYFILTLGYLSDKGKIPILPE
jgi:hypothetical protein